MSKKRKSQRSNRAAQEEKQAEKVIKWIFGVLVALAIVFLFIGILM